MVQPFDHSYIIVIFNFKCVPMIFKLIRPILLSCPACDNILHFDFLFLLRMSIFFVNVRRDDAM